MTLYRLPHYGYRFFAGTHYDVLPYVVILNGDKNVLWEKRESGTVTQSEESMTLMTFYGFPHHGNRSFAIASGWRFTGSLITGTDSSLALIMTFYRTWSFWTGIRMFCGKNGKAERWHRVKNLLLWWHFTAFLTTDADSSLSLRMTFFVPRHSDTFRSPSLVTRFLQIVISTI